MLQSTYPSFQPFFQLKFRPHGLMRLQYSQARIITFTGSITLLFLLLWLNFGRSTSVPFSSANSSFKNSPPFAAPDCDIQDILNRTLGFQKIFVINLPDRTDHRDAMSLVAAMTDLDIDYVEGVTRVEERALPPEGAAAKLKQAQLGNWRAHTNILRTIVEQNITSALILEDDADWDIRIKAQMQSFARAAHLLIQPLPYPSPPETFLDPSFPHPSPDQSPLDLDLSLASPPPTKPPSTSPYGDLHRWDLLWLGHCGAKFPQASSSTSSPSSSNNITPLGRAVLLNDTTVPEPQHLAPQWGDTLLTTAYPAHTRVVSHVAATVCTLAYAVSQPGARRLLYELGVHKLTAQTDLTLRAACEGTEGRKPRTCLTVQPQLFQHHRPMGAEAMFSDISDHGEGVNERAYTRNVRWSARVNLGRLVDGESEFVDLFQDGEERDDGLGFG